MLTSATYFAHPEVRARIREYCGAESADDLPTCAFVSSLVPRPHVTWETAARRSPADLPTVLDEGHDVARSLWDRQSLLVHLDVDYMNPDVPGDVLLRASRAFTLLDPLLAVIRAELTYFEMPLFALITGRGYHFTGRVPLDSPTVHRLSVIGCPASTRDLDSRIGSRHRCARPPRRQDEAAIGLGMVLEFLAHRLRPDLFGAAAATLPAFAAVPCGPHPAAWLLDQRRPLDRAAGFAGTERATLPDVSRGLSRLLEAYDTSAVAEFHRDFYSVPLHVPETWSTTYGVFDPGTLPPCVAEPLRAPNDLLLKPAAIQHVTRGLVANGWYRRHVAGLVLSKYAGNHAWADRWQRLDPARRADFDVRVFAGMLVTGIDQGLDFNCVSAQQKRLCPRTGCRHDLRTDRDRLLQRMEV